jgi:citrate lyase subunit beta/citryl-CoA lyase
MTESFDGPALLFCPGDRPERFAKALAAADTVLVDLEDAVAPDGKDAARATVRDALRDDPDLFVVRVNARGTRWHEADVAMLREAGASRVLLPKAESADDLAALPGLGVIALCETVLGIVNAREIARADNCAGLFWGAEDLTADLGGRSSRGPGGAYHVPIQHARSEVLLAAAAAGRPAIDAVVLDIGDDATLRAESEAACDVGFAAKGCVHPRQVPTVRAAFAPTDEQVAWARGLLAAVDEHGPGVFRYQGRMVDGPLYTLARTILSRTET